MHFLKEADRLVAAQRVQGDHEVASLPVIRLFHDDAVSQLLQNTRAADGRDAVPVSGACQCRGDEFDPHGMSPRAGAETGPHIAPVGGIKVAPGVADEARAGGPAAAPENLVSVEPGLRIILVSCRSVAGIEWQCARRAVPLAADK